MRAHLPQPQPVHEQRRRHRGVDDDIQRPGARGARRVRDVVHEGPQRHGRRLHDELARAQLLEVEQVVRDRAHEVHALLHVVQEFADVARRDGRRPAQLQRAADAVERVPAAAAAAHTCVKLTFVRDNRVVREAAHLISCKT